MELKLNEVTKKYGQKVALDRFSYTFGNGIYGYSARTARANRR